MADGASAPTHPATPVLVPLAILMLLGVVGGVGYETFFPKHPVVTELLRLIVLFLTGQATISELAATTSVPFFRFALYLSLFVLFTLSVFFFYLMILNSRKLAIERAKLMAPLYPPAGGVNGAPPAPGTAAGIGSAPSDGGRSATGLPFALPGADLNPPPEVREVNPKWLNVLNHMASESPAEWKLAILEADIMLDLMLDKMGYPGQSIGDKLKMVERSDFDTLDYAWEAHKVRNSIAHEGSDFVISRDEAGRVITMYEEVFKEFKYI